MPDRSDENTGKGSGYHLDEDLCLDLVNGLLPAEELRKALAHMDVCPSCEALVRARVSELERSRSQIGEVVHRLARETSSARHPAASLTERILAALRGSFRRRPLRIGALAAAVVIALLLILPLMLKPSYDPELILLPDIPADLRLRAGEDTEASDDFASGLAAYKRRDFSTAIQLLRNAEVTSTYAIFRDVYLGSALAWTGRCEETLKVLRPLTGEALPEPWGNGFRWTYFVALYKSGYMASADSLAHELARENDAIGERARRYLTQ